MKVTYTCLNCPMCEPLFNQYVTKELNLTDEEIYYSSYCDKIGGKIWWYSNGGCEDMYKFIDGYYSELKPKNHKKTYKHYKRNKYENKLYEKRKMKKLQKQIWWGVVDKGKYLKRCYIAPNAKKYYKRYANKIFRRNKDFNCKGSGYKKYFDLKWIIW